MNIDRIGVGVNFSAKDKIVKEKNSDDGRFSDALEKAVKNGDEKELREACRQFESIFLNMMFKAMKATIPKSGLLEDDMGRETFEEMLNEKLTDEASKAGGVGLRDVMFKQLSMQMKTAASKETKGMDDIKKQE